MHAKSYIVNQVIFKRTFSIDTASEESESASEEKFIALP